MRKKGILLVLLIIIISYFFLIYHPGIIDINKNGTSIDDQLENIEDMENDLPDTTPKANQPETTSATLLAVGDIMFHMPQNNSAFNGEGYNFKNNFKYVKKYIESTDLSIANFETVVLEGKPYSGFPRFNSPKETLTAIKDAGFNILITANNHCLDQGKDGLISTIDAIEDLDMKNIGTYKEEKETILIEDINDIKVGLLAYSYGFNGMEYTLTEDERGYMISSIDEEKIKEDIRKAKDLGSDIVTVFIHWGYEYHHEPSKEQVELGEKILDWGGHIVFGSHPHVIQKAEEVNLYGEDKFIIYSMGNFLSNQRLETLGNAYTEDGLMVKVELEKDLNENKTSIKTVKYIPTWVRKYQEGNKNQFEIIPIEEFLENEDLYNILKEEEKIRLKESLKRTLKKIPKY